MHIGIDPGQAGGLAIIDGTGRLIESYCFKKYTYHDICEQLFVLGGEIYKDNSNTRAYIEKVHAMPKQGVSSSFKFGMNYGIVQGLMIALQIPFELVTPQKWMKAMQCMTGGDKNVTKRKAQELFPGHKITHGNADAILIAEYGRRMK